MNRGSRPDPGPLTGPAPRRGPLSPVRTGINGISWDFMGVNGFLRISTERGWDSVADSCSRQSQVA